MLTYEVSTWQHLVNIATQSQTDSFRDSVTMKLTDQHSNIRILLHYGGMTKLLTE